MAAKPKTATKTTAASKSKKSAIKAASKETPAAPQTPTPMPTPAPADISGVDAKRARQARRAATILRSVSDPTRLQILMILSEIEEMHVGAIGDIVKQSQPAVSHHLSLLRHGSVVQARRVGQNSYYSLTKLGDSLVHLTKLLPG